MKGFVSGSEKRVQDRVCDRDKMKEGVVMTREGWR